jgi:hypothetical protein
LLWLTIVCGLCHCLAGGVLAVLCLQLGTTLAAQGALAQSQALVTGALWALCGIAMITATWWRAQRRAVVAPSSRVPAGAAALLFTLGPCEWLVPTTVLAVQGHGMAAGFAVWVPYTLLTVATMCGVVMVGAKWFRLVGRPAPVLAGCALLATGLLLCCGW